jgi:expansin (peptidoglycan-binding protein)
MNAKHLTTGLFVVWVVGVGLSSCAGNDDVTENDGGGSSGDGGAKASGSGGSTGKGGNGAGPGGSTGGGGMVSSGTGGKGGAAGSTSGAGGAGGRGGTTGAGGSTSGAGGMGTGTGGRGGMTGAGGASTGGAPGQGGQQGGTTCTVPTHSGSGSFTYYYFGQGTAKDGSGYRTACGYYGTESGTADTVNNIASTSPAANTYFVAIPGTSGFNTSGNCGACVEITGQNGTNIIATIIDECPYGSDGNNTACGNNPNGHLDVAKTAFDKLGYSVGNPTGTNWKFVPCPVSGNVKVRVKPSTPNEMFIENVVTSIKSVTMNGSGGSRTSYGTWHFGNNIPGGAQLSITDSYGRTINVTLPSNSAGNDQDVGAQFPKCN